MSTIFREFAAEESPGQAKVGSQEADISDED
jgi:hypothetical protein